MRTIIDLPDHQIAALGAFCEREKISRAEAVRRAVEILLAERGSASAEAAFGAWASRGDSRDDVAALREEWSQ